MYPLDVPERDIEDFYPLLGTRHVDPDNGLTYETTDVFQDKRGYNLVYRRLVTKGRLENHLSKSRRSETRATAVRAIKSKTL